MRGVEREESADLRR